MSDLKKHKALIASVASAFVANPTAQELHVTIDGNCFLSANKNAAELHARRIGTPINTVSRSDFESEKMEELKKALDDKISAEKAIADAEALANAEKEAAEKLAAEELAKAEKETAEKATAESEALANSEKESEALANAEKEAAEKAASESEDANRDVAAGKLTAKGKTTKKS
jgi:hypothetical protein